MKYIKVERAARYLAACRLIAEYDFSLRAAKKEVGIKSIESIYSFFHRVLQQEPSEAELCKKIEYAFQNHLKFKCKYPREWDGNYIPFSEDDIMDLEDVVAEYEYYQSRPCAIEEWRRSRICIE